LAALTGGYLYDRQLVGTLQDRGHRVEILALPRRSWAAGLLDNFFPGPLARCAGQHVLVQDALCHPSLLRLNRRLQGHGRVPVVALVHQVRSSRSAKPPSNPLARWVERAYLRSVTACIFNSPDTRRRASDLVGGEVRSTVAPPGGDRFRPCPGPRTDRHPHGPLRLLFVGNLSPVKGLLPLLQSLSALAPGIWRLDVVGSPSFDARHARRVVEWTTAHGLSDRVRFRGVLDGDALCSAYRESDLFTMPFADEGFGIAALEAMGFGLPVIGSQIGGVPEFVRHGENGFLAAPGDLAGVRDHIELLHRDRARLAAMGEAARRAFGAQPTWAESMRGACEFLERVHPGS
jgi:glycosyltransferase involved in cell wall biosynthesis